MHSTVVVSEESGQVMEGSLYVQRVSGSLNLSNPQSTLILDIRSSGNPDISLQASIPELESIPVPGSSSLPAPLISHPLQLGLNMLEIGYPVNTLVVEAKKASLANYPAGFYFYAALLGVD